MMRTRDHQVEDYFNGKFRYSPSVAEQISKPRFDALNQQFSLKYDDFYHPYFEKEGDRVKSNKALIRVAFELFQKTYGHLPLAYKNCAISSGTWAHLDAVTRNYHTTDRLSRIVGGDWHIKAIKDNSQRSLERIALIKDLFSEVFFIGPTMFEGSTRAFSKDNGHHLTAVPFQAEEYMAFWNMVIDMTEGFVLDDVRPDMPSIETIEREIDLAKDYSEKSRGRPILQTSDWNNSRNSIYEMVRANYIRFGVHPLRPDAKMDMRIYDAESNRLYSARLIDTLKPVIQNMLRFGPQGIAVDSASITVARLMDLNRMRTDDIYNSRQIAPLDLSNIDKSIAVPKSAENKEFLKIFDKFEPVFLEYFANQINPNGLSDDYVRAHKNHPMTGKKFGDETVKWQRENIPKNVMLDLWELTLPNYAETKPYKVEPIAHIYTPQRRLHDFENHPFAPQDGEIWADRPFDNLDPMFGQLAKSHMGVLEIVANNQNAPEFNGIMRDLKRGDPALSATQDHGVADIAILPGVLGKKFAAEVRDANLEHARQDLKRAQSIIIGKTEKSVPAFSTSIVAEMNSIINREIVNFNGPGPKATPSDYRLGLGMEMLRRNFTTMQFSKNWETSEDEVRVMMLATKIEFGKVERPAGNNTELKVWDEERKIIPFADRVERLHTYLSVLKDDPKIKRCIAERNTDSLEVYRLRYISLTLARMIEVYDCLKDQDYNNGRFEIRRVENFHEFSKDLDSISQIRADAIQNIEDNWCWLWTEKDCEDLRRDYKEKWLSVQGWQAQNAGAQPDHGMGIKRSYLPK